MDNTSFDRYSEDYDATLARGIAVSGEDKNFFARGRIALLRGDLEERGARPENVLDYGCGIGSATPFLLELPSVREVLGVDVSRPSLDVARRTFGSPHAQFAAVADQAPREAFDLAYCNGVFHHIALDGRGVAAAYIYAALRRGGWFACWENNAWSPATRYVMHRCPFDDDAIPLTPPYARHLMAQAGFEIVSTRYAFIFPRFLRRLRPLEAPLARVPLGTQYQILCRKP
jgi:SAM-dependent methyltransferase